jgi:hypothetical protein
MKGSTMSISGLHNHRLAVLARARAMLGLSGADQWLTARNSRLGGVAPLSLIDDPLGAQMVLQELTRIDASAGGR